MSRILRVFDLSSYGYAGNVNKRAFFEGPIVQLSTGYTQRIVPAGGISLLFNQLYQYVGNCDLVFCADRTPTIKKEMFPNYKISRSHPTDVGIQKEVMEFVLNACGLTVLAEEGYEADDLIYSVVQKFKRNYDNVYVHTADSDLFLLVDENVSIDKTHSRSKEVTIENYPYVVKKNKITPYNMLSFLKVLNGDPKDDIPPLDKYQAQQILDILDTDFYVPKMGNKEFIRATLESFAPWTLTQFDLVYPLDAPVPDEIKCGDIKLIREFGYAMKNSLFNFVNYVSPEVNSAVEQMVEKGLYID